MRHQEKILCLKKPLNFPLKSPPLEMKKAFRNANMEPCAQELFTRWPNLRESSLRLTSFLTPYWPDHRAQGGSLLVNCLAKGIRDARKAFARDGYDLDEQKAFIGAVADELAESLGLTLMITYHMGKDTKRYASYDPNINGFLDTIILSSASDALTWVTKPNPAFDTQQGKLLCAAKVFTMTELQLAGLID
jgi:hypothetical protein